MQNVKQESLNMKAQEKSLQILYKKLDKDFQEALQQVKSKNQNESEDHQSKLLTEEEVLDIMHIMGFIDSQIVSERNNAQEIISFLGGRTTHRNLLVLLCQIEKILLPNMTAKEESEEPEKLNTYGRFNEEGEFVLSEKESNRIFKKCDNMRKKRQTQAKT